MGVAAEVAKPDRNDGRRVWVETGSVTAVATSPTGRVTVNVAGGDVVMDTIATVVVGDLVRVLRAENGAPPVCLGRANALPTTATIKTVASGVSVDVLGTDGVTYLQVPYVLSYTPAVGDFVAVSWEQPLGLVLGKQSTAAGSPDPSIKPPVPSVPPKPPGATSGTALFGANNSGTWNGSRWWTNKVYFGQSNPHGAWFYGTKVRDTLAGAVAQPGSAIYLPVEVASGASLVQFGVHGSSTFPPGDVAAVAGRNMAAANGTGWWPLDTDIAQYLIDHAGAGIAVWGPGYRIFSGTGANPDSGKLSINWKK